MEHASCGVDNSEPSNLRHDLRQYVAAGLLLSGVSDADDPALLRRAVADVLDNAARAAGGNGYIDVFVRDSGDDSAVEATVSRLRFGRGPRGSGHGMSAIAMAVRACRGRLEMVSDPAPGTTVRLVLPSWRAES
jgi:signal transduction histidine kinase